MSDHYIEMILFKPYSAPDSLLEIGNTSNLIISKIYKIIIEGVNTTAIFTNRHSYNENKRLTGWKANDNLSKPLSFFSVFINTYDEDFSREFIIAQPFNEKPIYYSEFVLKPVSNYLELKVSLVIRNRIGSLRTEESLSFSNISKISCCNGIFTIHFTSNKAYKKVKSLMNWPDTKEKFSLQMPIKKKVKSYSIEIM